jgi:hypothetical protein
MRRARIPHNRRSSPVPASISRIIIDLAARNGIISDLHLSPVARPQALLPLCHGPGRSIPLRWILEIERGVLFDPAGGKTLDTLHAERCRTVTSPFPNQRLHGIRAMPRSCRDRPREWAILCAESPISPSPIPIVIHSIMSMNNDSKACSKVNHVFNI